ncbi:MAG: hypothetical protein NUV34_00960 [Sulfuricaulis sp.]|nr:hypothetical protein [Sulfuricaulis sp.]
MRVAIITARAGSKRIPGKNKRMFHGKPIIEYPIAALKAVKVVDQIVVSTDDDDIRDIAWANGARYLEREPEFAGDAVQTREVMIREVDRLGLKDNDEVCCVYPTAAMLTPGDIEWGQLLMWARPALFVASIGTQPLGDAGMFYWALAAHWKNLEIPMFGIRTAFFPIEPERVCDINTPEDWTRAEAMYAALHQDDKVAYG